MLSTKIKEATKTAHQELEKKVIVKLKSIQNDVDYAGLLKYFYAYFGAVEKAIAPYITPEVLPDLAERRNSAYLKRDIEELGASVKELPEVHAPAVTNTIEALAAMYVMEGSIMGGPIIVQMLGKYGVTKGVSFFSGYGESTAVMWSGFVSVMNAAAKTAEDETRAIKIANDTFSQFADVFTEVELA